MDYLVDTSILLRLINTADPQHAIAEQAVQTLRNQGQKLLSTPQVFIELRSAATRPTTANGLGLSPVTVEAEAAKFETSFPVLGDTPDIFPKWKALVQALGVIGKQVHDARLVAVCHVHGVSHLLTFNTAHFARLGGFGPGLTVVHPSQV